VHSIRFIVDGYVPPIAVEPCAKLFTCIPLPKVSGTFPVKAETPAILLG